MTYKHFLFIESVCYENILEYNLKKKRSSDKTLVDQTLFAILIFPIRHKNG